jgi:hypothetical protein
VIAGKAREAGDATVAAAGATVAGHRKAWES